MVELYEQIVKYVDEHINEDISIDDLLKTMNYSKRHLYRVFRDYNDISLTEYIRREKLRAAARELRSERKMYDIALDYGYETHAGFYKAFQSVFDCSPSTYKNNILRSVVMSTENIGKTREELNTAIEELTQKIELDPHNASLYIERAKNYSTCLLHQHEKALDDFVKALELDPGKIKDFRENYHTYTQYHGRQTEGPKRMVEIFTKAIELDPDFTMA